MRNKKGEFKMAKVTKSYENGEVKTTLTFRGKDFVVEEGQYEDGVRKSKQVCFEMQIGKTLNNDDDIEELKELAFKLDCADSDEEIEEVLDELDMYE